MRLLGQYAPQLLGGEDLEKLSGAFTDLRQMVESGALAYP